MFRFTRRHKRPSEAANVWAACAALLDYPTPQLLESLDDIEELVPDAAELTPLFAHLRAAGVEGLREVQQEYVQTFDHTRKCALYLTYFAYGDTRRRGVALVEFKQAYRRGGIEWDEACGELPDHLCAVLQFGATVDADGAWRLLNDHRAGIEMLRIALGQWRRDDGTVGSPWHGALLALCNTLPTLEGDEADAVARLIEQGPPAENVGLTTYGTDPFSLPSAPPAMSPPDSAPLIAPASIPVGAPR